jgi:cell division septation protein DedD
MKAITIITLAAVIFLTIGGCAKQELNAFAEENNNVEVTEEPTTTIDAPTESEAEVIVAMTKVPKSLTTMERLRREDPVAYEAEMQKVAVTPVDSILTAASEPVNLSKYAVQLSCVKDKSYLDNSISKLEAKGYRTKISKRESGGCVYYRLRLAGAFSKEEANELGLKVKDEILDITDYLVLKVN